MADSSAIQPIGFHLGLSSEWCVDAVSANIGDFLPDSAKAIIGQPVTGLFSETAIHDIRNRLALLRGERSIEHLFRFVLVDGGEPFDLTLYQSGNGYGVDAERCTDHGFGDATGIIAGMLARIDEGDDVARLCEQAARQVRALTGFDQVSIWQHGAMTAYSTRKPYSGEAPPAPVGNDFLIVDLGAEPVEILREQQDQGAVRHSTLRAPSQEERDWLVPTGAKAAFVLPLASSGEPWGLICCQHQAPYHLSVERRGIACLFARIVGLRIEVARFRSSESGA